MRLEDKLALVIAKSLGSVDKPKLSIELKSRDINCFNVNTAKENIYSILNLNLDLKLFYKEVEGDKTMSGRFCRT